MREKINKVRHLAILFITIVVFFLGVLIGGNVEELRVQDLYTQLQEQDLDYQNVLTESNYIDYVVGLKESGDNMTCNTIEGAYYTSILNLEDSRIRLENYINTGSVKTEEFDRLKQHYANVQINYWLLANKIENLCDNQMNPILFFYADDETCPECQDQGVHLTYVKQKLQDNVLVFSFDMTKGGPVKLLQQKYDIHETYKPTIVVDEEVYDFSTNEEIFKILCNNGLEDDVCLIK